MLHCCCVFSDITKVGRELKSIKLFSKLYKYSHLVLMLSHIKGQTCGEELSLCAGGGINRCWNSLRKALWNCISTTGRWGKQQCRALGNWFTKSHRQRDLKAAPCLKGPWDPGNPICRALCLLLPSCCLILGESFIPSVVLPSFTEGRWYLIREEAGGKIHCTFWSSKSHKRRVQYAPWKYHLHLAQPPLGVLSANNRRQPKSN